jgi:hypothetical protein
MSGDASVSFRLSDVSHNLKQKCLSFFYLNEKINYIHTHTVNVFVC